MRRVRALPILNRLGEVELDVGRASQALDRVAVCRLSSCALEDATCARGIADPQAARPSAISSWTGTVTRRSSHGPVIWSALQGVQLPCLSCMPFTMAASVTAS